MAEEHPEYAALPSPSLPAGCSACKGEPFVERPDGLWVRCQCPRGEALRALDRIHDCKDLGLQSPSQWLTQAENWPVPGLLGYKKQIEVQLLKADAVYHRARASKCARWPGDAGYDALLAAFDGVAGVLFEANILTQDLLEDKLPSLIFNIGENGPWAEWGNGGSSSGFKEAYARSFRGPISKWMARLRESEMDRPGSFAEGGPVGQLEAGAERSHAAEVSPGSGSSREASAILEETDTSASGRRASPQPGFPNRASWLRGRLLERSWDKNDVARQNGPDRKTVQKILDGRSVRPDVLERLATALSVKCGKVDVLGIPPD